MIDHLNNMQELLIGKPIYIYGTGTVGRDTWRVLAAKGYQITCYMDHRISENPFIGKIPIIAPEMINRSNISSTIIILAIHNREVDMPALIDHLKSLGYAHFVSMIDMYDDFADELGARYWLVNRTFYRAYKTQINAANELWTDDLSRETYTKTLQFRVSGNYSLLPEPDFTHQYFPPHLPPWKQPIRLIDCGAYDGDVIRNFMKNDYTFSALAAFEPDLHNYSCLVTTLREIGKNIPEVNLFPCGVSSTSRMLGFSSGLGEASGVTASGGTIIHGVALDDAVPNFRPTLIKMDIESAEMDALLGARNLISKYQPGLAISVYHTPAHLWEIPLWVAEFAEKNGLQYTYYLRSHARNCFDTVFYAVPHS